MVTDTKKTGADLFIVDNSDQDWKVKEYLREWTDIAHKFDIATGYFEIGGESPRKQERTNTGTAASFGLCVPANQLLGL